MAPASDDAARTERERERQLIEAARRQEAPRAESDPTGNEEATRAAAPDRLSSAAMPLAVDAFPGYELLREIHRGGQGIVYQALQKSTNRKVAIKVLREGQFADLRDKIRFEREVQILGQLDHPHIVTIHDRGEAAGHFYYVMDYISGKPLDQHMEEQRSQGPKEAGRGTIPETLQLFAKICEAVNAAHLRGIIHRDLKPGNIRVDPSGEPHVLDFGLAKVSAFDPLGGDGSPVMTVTGQFVGSLPWSSPEQAEGVPNRIDTRTDVYALGVILYQMLTGKFPYEVVGQMRDVLDNILKAEPVKPSTLRRQINDEVETIVLKCLQKERERRYQTAGELAKDIRHYLHGEPIEAKRDSALYVLKKTLRRYRLPVAIAAGFALLLAVSAVLMSIQAERNRRLAESESAAKQAALTAKDLAEKQRQEAVQQRAAAFEARNAERRLRELADARELAARRYAYILNMQAVRAAWDKDDLSHTIALLETQRPETGQLDLRHFEWHYFWRLCHNEQLTLDCVGAVCSAAFSPDAKLVATGIFGKRVCIWDAGNGTLLRDFDAPGEYIGQVAFTPDNKYLIAGSGLWPAGREQDTNDDQTSITMWEIKTAKKVLSLEHQRFLTMTPDGAALLSRLNRRVIAVVDLPSGQERARFEKHASPVTEVAVSPDGKWVASACGLELPPVWGEMKSSSNPDKAIRIWELSSGTEIRGLTGHEDDVTQLTFHQNGAKLISGDRKGQVRLWDFATGNVDQAFSAARGSIGTMLPLGDTRRFGVTPIGICFATDTALLDKETRLWNVQANKNPTEFMRSIQGRLWAAYAHSDAFLIGSPNSSRTINLWFTMRRAEYISRAAPTRVAIHDQDILCLALSPDEKKLVTGTKFGEAKVWDGTIPTEWAGLPVPWFGDVLAVAAEGPVLAARERSERGESVAIQLWNMDTGAALHRLEAGSVFKALLSSDGRILATQHYGPGASEARFWDTTTGKQTASVAGLRSFFYFWLSPNGRLLVTSEDRQKEKSPTAASQPSSIPALPQKAVDGRLFEPRADLKLWDLSAGAVEVKLEDNQFGGTGAVLFSPDGQSVAVLDNGVRVWDTATGRLKIRLTGNMTAVGYAPDGKYLATSTYDGNVRIWDTNTWLEVVAFNAAQRESSDERRRNRDTQRSEIASATKVESLAFSPDGRCLAVGYGGGFSSESRPSDAVLYSLEAKAKPIVLRGHQGSVQCIAFSPDGARIATGSSDNTVKLWDSATGQNVASFDDHAPVYLVAFIRSGRTLLSAGLKEHDLRLRTIDASCSGFLPKPNQAPGAPFRPKSPSVESAAQPTPESRLEQLRAPRERQQKTREETERLRRESRTKGTAAQSRVDAEQAAPQEPAPSKRPDPVP